MKKSAYSVVLAVREANPGLACLESLRRLSPAERPREIILAVGQNPSRQRNLGVVVAKSPLVYFLDDDSAVPPGTPRHLISHFDNERTAVAGGPNLAALGATPFERTVSAVLASWLGSFSVRSRYSSQGSVREATEKDLILCNLMVRRDTFQSLGGFREDLYPNEENEFLNRLLHQGRQLLYNPGAYVNRPRRKNWAEWVYQAFRYGRGRAQQMKVYLCLSDLVHLAPGLFLIYLLSFPVVVYGMMLHPVQPIHHLLFALPLLIFVFLDFGTGLSAAFWHRRLGDLWKVPLLILARHLAYGLGFWVGLLVPIPPTVANPVKLFEAKYHPKGFTLREISAPRVKHA